MPRPALFDLGRKPGRVHCRHAAPEQRSENPVDEPPWAAVDERQGGRDEGVVGSPEAHFLRERQSEHHPRLAVVGQALARGAVDQCVQVRQAPERFPRDGDGEAVVGGGKVADRISGGLERKAVTEHRVEHLQGRATCT